MQQNQFPQYSTTKKALNNFMSGNLNSNPNTNFSDNDANSCFERSYFNSIYLSKISASVY